MKLKTVNIKGKEYVEVNERIRAFRTKFPGWSLETKIIELDDTKVVMQAIVRDESSRTIATGTAFEKQDSSFINKTSYIENCETSAWGRALGNLGIGVDTSIATAEEVNNAISNQNTKKASKPSSKKSSVKIDTSGADDSKTLSDEENRSDSEQVYVPMPKDFVGKLVFKTGNSDIDECLHSIFGKGDSLNEEALALQKEYLKELPSETKTLFFDKVPNRFKPKVINILNS